MPAPFVVLAPYPFERVLTYVEDHQIAFFHAASSPLSTIVTKPQLQLHDVSDWNWVLLLMFAASVRQGPQSTEETSITIYSFFSQKRLDKLVPSEKTTSLVHRVAPESTGQLLFPPESPESAHHSLQYPVTQSVPSKHICPLIHAGHRGPPQSISVSNPFFTPSAH